MRGAVLAVLTAVVCFATSTVRAITISVDDVIGSAGNTVNLQISIDGVPVGTEIAAYTLGIEIADPAESLGFQIILFICSIIGNKSFFFCLYKIDITG